VLSVSPLPNELVVGRMKLFHITLSPFFNLASGQSTFPVFIDPSERRMNVLMVPPFLFYPHSYLWMGRLNFGMQSSYKTNISSGIGSGFFYYGVFISFQWNDLPARYPNLSPNIFILITKYLPLPWRSTLYPVSFGWGIKPLSILLPLPLRPQPLLICVLVS